MGPTLASAASSCQNVLTNMRFGSLGRIANCWARAARIMRRPQFPGLVSYTLGRTDPNPSPLCCQGAEVAKEPWACQGANKRSAPTTAA